MKFIKKYGKYVLLFFLFLIWDLIVIPVDFDEIWNYGFSVSIYEGLITYKDFNMVVTPFCGFLFSLPFHIFGKSMLVFHIEGAIVLTFTCYLLFKLIDDKAWIIISTWFIGVHEIYPNYNFLIYTILLLIILCEKKENNDYLIGILIGIAILTKQTIGICIALPCILYYIKEPKRILKRLIGMLIPIFIFLFYLIITKTLYAFIDLCILGLFDFGNNNNKNTFITIYIVMVVITILGIIKDKKDISNYYILAYYSVSIPIIDLTHIQFVISGFLLFILNKSNKNIKIIKIFTISLAIITAFMIIITITEFELNNYPNSIPNFEYRYISKNELKILNKVNKKYKKYRKKHNVIILGSMKSYYLKLINNDEITYLDLINNGNFGYKGEEKMINKIKNIEGIYFVEKTELKQKKKTQVNQKAIKYVMDNATKIDEINCYEIYIFK